MIRLAAFVSFLVACLLGGVAASAQPGGRHMDVRLVAETAAAAPGSTITLAFVMRPQPGWHGYWRNPGDAGAEPRVDVAAARGLAGGAARNIRCRTGCIVLGLMNYVYRARLRLARDRPRAGERRARGDPADRRAARLSGLHQRSLRPRDRDGHGRARHRRGPATPIPPSTPIARRCRGRSPPRARFEVAGRAPPPRYSAARRRRRYPSPISSRRRSTRSAIRRRRAISRSGDMLIVETGAGAARGPARGDRGRARDRRPAPASR